MPPSPINERISYLPANSVPIGLEKSDFDTDDFGDLGGNKEIVAQKAP